MGKRSIKKVLITEKLGTIYLDEKSIGDIISELQGLKKEYIKSHKGLILKNEQDLYESYYNVVLYGTRDETDDEKYIRMREQKEADKMEYETYLKLKHKFK